MAKKKNPLKGLAKHEARVASKPVRAKVTLKKHEKKSDNEPLKTPKGRVSKERNTMGGFNIAHLKREMKKKLGY